MIAKWLFSVYAKKAVISIGKFLGSWLTSVAVTSQLTKYGVNVDPLVAEAAITSTLLAGLKFIEDKYELNKANKEAVK